MTVRPVHGLLLVDKPAGPTSHDVVARVRRCLGGPRTGHGGTLDPGASGLLVVLVGCATRLARYLDDEPKRYAGSFRLGVRTSTDDMAGEVLSTHEGPLPDAVRVLAAARGLTGSLEQVPPSVSARHVGGQRLHRLARRGLAVSAPATRVQVLRFDAVPTEDPALWRFDAEVSTGTYVRALVRDLGEAVGCGGALASLTRTAAGAFRLERAMPLVWQAPLERDPLERALLAPEQIPLRARTVVLEDARDVERFRAGSAITVPHADDAPQAHRVLAPGGALLGIGALVEGVLRPRVVLAR